MRKGLDRNQKAKIAASEESIFNYIQKNGLVLFKQIVNESGINDSKTVRKRLLSLIKKEKVSTSRFFHVVKKNRGRWYYYSKPVSAQVQAELTIDSYLKKVGNKYYYGIIDYIPIYVQYDYKFQFLFYEYKKLLEKFKRKSKRDDIESINRFEIYNLQLLAGLKIILNSIISDQDSYFTFKPSFDNLLKQSISKMDLIYRNYKTLLGNKFAEGPIKTIIAKFLVENTKHGAMKKLGFSSKLGSHIEKELFNHDGSPNIKKINQNNMMTIGVKEFPPHIASGETLYKLWKKNQ